jgi:hypothetical protein
VLASAKVGVVTKVRAPPAIGLLPSEVELGLPNGDRPRRAIRKGFRTPPSALRPPPPAPRSPLPANPSSRGRSDSLERPFSVHADFP